MAGCGGGLPLLHPARTLPDGEVRAALGFSGNVALGSLASDLRAARDQAAQLPDVPGTPGTNPVYARGALVSAVVAPGLAPFVAARVGVGRGFEGGLAYTGRGARADVRRGVELGRLTLSVGAGGSALFYGRDWGGPLPNVDLTELRGYGADVPILLGWQSAAGLYHAWIGARGGFDSATIASVTSEPRPGYGPISLSATRLSGGGVVGFAAGLGHVHLAMELEAAYSHISGTYNANQVTVRGVGVVPASALWLDF